KNTKPNLLRTTIDKLILRLQMYYGRLVKQLLRFSWFIPLVFIAGLYFSIPGLISGKQEFLPKMDDGLISVTITADPGITLIEMDKTAKEIENLFMKQAETESVFTLAGGSVFGRTAREIPNRTSIKVQLLPLSQREISSADWIKKMTKAINKKQLAGVKVRMRQRGIRGIRTSRGDDDISLRVQGPKLQMLEDIASDLSDKLKSISGIRNIENSSEEEYFELSVDLDRERTKALGLNVEDVSQAIQIALEGKVITDFLQGDRAYSIRLRLPMSESHNPQAMESVVLFPGNKDKEAVYLSDVAKVQLVKAPATIKRDNQMRIVEITSSLNDDATIGEVLIQVNQLLAEYELPKGYTIYEAGATETLQQGKQLTSILLVLALFLVFVVMAVQYESLRNPLIIMLSVPFAAIGVAIGIEVHALSISMPIWLGMIMLAGIVVNNAIVLVEYIEILRAQGMAVLEAITEAASLRLRPILMTTLTTVVGMLPLALGLGEGAEMLQPLAVTIVWGLSFSMLVSLVLVPVIYKLFNLRTA
ncbi:MAG: efflux RND transporter permease subunit, partial [Gammaproteobacteria bacterium]|nr:efflux RND transporter permease subunit [Gammaproteobacteria bacterium]